MILPLEICKKHAPLKKQSQGKKPKDHHLKTLVRKLKRLKFRLKCIETLSPSSPRSEVIRKEILALKDAIKCHSYMTSEKNERRAIAKIKSKPKHFYQYVKKQSKVKKRITQLYNQDGDLHTEKEVLANILQRQFVSSFSNPLNPDKVIPSLPSRTINTLSDFSINYENIIGAIDEIDINSSCPGYSIPAPVLKNCKHELAEPLLIMWKHSTGW